MIATQTSGKTFTRATKPANDEMVMEGPAENQEIDLEAAVHDHYKLVYRFALHLTRHQEDAADLTQNAYETLFLKQSSIQNPSKVRAWLQSTVYRKFIDQKRRVIRFPSVEFDEHQDSQIAHSRDSASRIDAKAALDALYELDEELRAPLILFYLESHSYKEIAGILELPVGTVMSRLYRGKSRLYEILNGGGK